MFFPAFVVNAESMLCCYKALAVAVLDCERSFKQITEREVLESIKTVFEDSRNACSLKMVEGCNIYVLIPGFNFCVCLV